MNIEIDDDIYKELVELSNEINNQNHRCTAMPYLFQIQEDFRVWDTGLNGDHFVFLTQNFDSEYSLDEKGIKEYCDNVDIPIPENAESMDIYDNWFKDNKLTVSSY